MVHTPGKNNVVADALSRVQIFSLTSTQHSAEEDSSDMIECTEAPLNAFKLQIVLEKDANEDILVSYPFPGFKKVIIRVHNFTEQSLTDIIRKYFIPNKLTGLNCSEEILGKFQNIFKEYSSTKMYKIRFTQNILKDITNTEEQENIIQVEHERAHRGIEENKRKILRKFYFPKITQKIRDFIKVCDACNTCKYDRRPLKVQLQETPIPNHPFEILH